MDTTPKRPTLDDDMPAPAGRDRATVATVALAALLAAAGGLVTAGVALLATAAGLIVGGVLLSGWALFVLRGAGS